MGFLDTHKKDECYGCELCKQVCMHNAISMVEDEEGFNYPHINKSLCVECDKCRKACIYDILNDDSNLECFYMPRTVFGGYNLDAVTRRNSTSGGAFSAIAQAWCDSNYVIFGAASTGLNVYHTYVDDVACIDRFRKSKYLQSKVGMSYFEVREFLKEGKKVLFSGTPCQIAALKSYLDDSNTNMLLTVEVACEGVPSKKYIQKYDFWLKEKYGANIAEIDYRYKDNNKWDFEVEHITLKNGISLKRDRWFNPFWQFWISHLMSRPSCYHCRFARKERIADITLADLWGVHLYCPELYAGNTGASLVLGNTDFGKQVIEAAKQYMNGHNLDYNEALKYQSVLRTHIPINKDRDEFMQDLMNMDYLSIKSKWYKRPSVILLFKKYVWGNRQKVAFWNLIHRYNRHK